MGEELIPDGLRKLTGRVYDAIAPWVAKNEAYVFVVTRGTHGAPWLHGFAAGSNGINVNISSGGNITATPESTRVTLVHKPNIEKRDYIDINDMWGALKDTHVFKCIYNLNGASEEYDGGLFYENPHFGVDMYVPGGKCDTIADTLFLCLAWGYLYSLPQEDNEKTVGCNMGRFFELSPAGTEIPVAMSNVEGGKVRAGFELLTRELKDRGVFTRNRTLNDIYGFEPKGS